MSKRGGWRPGSGRPKNQPNFRKVAMMEAKEVMVKQILEYWHPLIQTKIDQALGNVQISKDGKTFYNVEPSETAANFLIEMVVGKAKEPYDGKGDGQLNSPAIEQLAESIRDILDNKQREIKSIEMVEDAEIVHQTMPPVIPGLPEPVTPIVHNVPPQQTKPLITQAAIDQARFNAQQSSQPLITAELEIEQGLEPRTPAPDPMQLPQTTLTLNPMAILSN